MNSHFELRSKSLKVNKLLILFCILFQSFFGYAQKSQFGDSLSYDMSQDLALTKDLKDKTEFKVYLGRDGQVIKVGDKLKIGPPSGNRVNVVSNSGTIQGARSSSGSALYANENVGRYMFLAYKTLNSAFFSPEKTGANILNEVDIIESIYVLHSGSKKNSPVIICVSMNNPNMKKIAGANIRYVFDYDRAVESGEIVNMGKKIVNKQQDIARLKELKELVDLGVITQADYEKEKAELSKIILKSETPQ